MHPIANAEPNQIGEWAGFAVARGTVDLEPLIQEQFCQIGAILARSAEYQGRTWIGLHLHSRHGTSARIAI